MLKVPQKERKRRGESRKMGSKIEKTAQSTPKRERKKCEEPENGIKNRKISRKYPEKREKEEVRAGKWDQK